MITGNAWSDGKETAAESPDDIERNACIKALIGEDGQTNAHRRTARQTDRQRRSEVE